MLLSNLVFVFAGDGLRKRKRKRRSGKQLAAMQNITRIRRRMKKPWQEPNRMHGRSKYHARPGCKQLLGTRGFSNGEQDISGGVTGDGHSPECGKCKELVQGILLACKAAQHTAKEAEIYSKTPQQTFNQIYNYARLKPILLDTAFIVSTGEYAVHHACLQAAIPLSNGFFARLHRKAIEIAGAECTMLTKHQVLAQNLAQAIVVPESCMVSAADYFSQLRQEDMVEVPSTLTRQHGLTGRRGNRSKTHLRDLFRTFVKVHRQPTGRTRDQRGRFHGSEFYLDSKFTAIRKQWASDREKSRSDAEILSQCFLDGLPQDSPTVSHSTVAVWFHEDFNQAGAEFQHTTLSPHKSDVCPLCEQLKNDMASCTMAIQRHRSQPDQTPARDADITILEKEWDDLEARRVEHKAETGEAQLAHKKRIEGAYTLTLTL